MAGRGRERRAWGRAATRCLSDGDARLRAPAERWELETETLHYDADTGHAWSTTPATLRQPPQRMSGERFDAWLHDNRARLTDNVRGHHPPETSEESSP